MNSIYFAVPIPAHLFSEKNNIILRVLPLFHLLVELSLLLVEPVNLEYQEGYKDINTREYRDINIGSTGI